MTALSSVSVFDVKSKDLTATSTVNLPAVFSAPIRNDIVQFVHMNLSKNRRQAHGVDPRAGQKHSAESWGTGRAVARIPRVAGSGTHRSGQATFGNMTRKGRMFNPLKVWRRWARRVNIKHKRHAVSSAIAASAIAPLVQARGHKVKNVPSVPLVVDNAAENIEKTKEAVAMLKKVGAYEDVKKVIDTKGMRAGKGKMRNRRYQMRKGPLVIYGTENVKLNKALRNIPGVECCHVSRLNLLQLAPGGHLGRFIIWTQNAVAKLDNIFGSYSARGQQKGDYQLQRSLMTNADLTRIINSNEIQSVVNAAKQPTHLHYKQKKNPLKSNVALFRLNPNAKLVKETARKNNEAQAKRRQDALKAKRGCSASMSKEQKKTAKENKAHSQAWIKNYNKTIKEGDQAAKDEEAAWVKEGLVQEDEDEE